MEHPAPKFDGKTEEPAEGGLLRIDNLEVRCIVGIRPHEREREQPLMVSLAFPADFRAAAKSGNLADTVDYSALAKDVRRFIIEGRYELLETLIEELGAHLMAAHIMPTLWIKVRKPEAIPDCGGPALSRTFRRGADSPMGGTP